MSNSSSMNKEDNQKQNLEQTNLEQGISSEYANYPEEAEKANARWAMLGFVALIGAYSTTGQIIPGVF